MDGAVGIEEKSRGGVGAAGPTGTDWRAEFIARTIFGWCDKLGSRPVDASLPLNDIIWRLVRQPGVFGGGGLGMTHSDVLRLTIPQFINLTRPEQKQGGGPVPTPTRTRIEWEASRADSVAIQEVMKGIRSRGRKSKRR